MAKLCGRLAVVVGLCCLPTPVFAAEAVTADKSAFHLFHPTPSQWMREMSTDRPDKTESARTVDAGHFQFEVDLLSYTHDRDRSAGGERATESWAVAPVNLKVGLFNDVDLQMVLDTYTRVRTSDGGAGGVERQSGFGDVAVRLKKNFWGNDGGETAFAMMPFVKLPTNQDGIGNQAVEGGAIFVLGFALPAGWDSAVMTEVDFLRNDADKGFHSSFINSITFAHDIHGKLGGYVEFFSEVSTERDASWVGTVDLGLTYSLTDNIQLDTGVNIGVTGSADDFNPFLGLSWRF